MIYTINLGDRRNTILAYEIFISAMALVAVLINLVEFSDRMLLQIANNMILVIFCIDYFTRLIISSDKKKFFKDNILDLIAIIPLSSVFKVFRMAKFFKIVRLSKTTKLVRVLAFSRKFHVKVKKFLQTNGFIYVIYITGFIIFLGAGLLYITERGNLVTSFGDAVWISFCSALLFGYDGIGEIGTAGKVITGILVIAGLFFTGMFTATTVTFFKRSDNDNEENRIENRVLDLSDFDDRKFHEAQNYIYYLRHKESECSR
jgi:voltage-gated potassium channel